MIRKEDLLERLQQYDYFVVNEMIDLTTGVKRGIYQTSVYHNVKLHWNDSVFKFWNDKDEDVKLYINSNLESIEWNDNDLTLHIVDCPETFNIRCHNK